MFPTKKAITDHIRAVRDRTPVGQTITDPVVLELLRHHPQWDEKSQDMAYISTGFIQGHPASPPRKEIVLLKNGGQLTDISWSKLVPRLQKDGKLQHPDPAVEHLNEVRIAARLEVEDQLQPHRKQGFELDHAYPLTFEQLLYDWVCKTELCLHDISIESSHGAVVSRWFANRGLAASWCSYHRDKAVLILRTKEEHDAQPCLRIDWSSVLATYQA